MAESSESESNDFTEKETEKKAKASVKNSWKAFPTSTPLFETFRGLKKGALLKPDGNKRQFVCETCGYTTDTKRKLTYHVVMRHKKKEFVCEECGYSTINKHILDRHVIALHSSVKPFVCSLCGYQTAQKGRLTAHVSIKHDGAKPFACKLCDFSTAYKVSLKLHIKGKHQDLRPFQCEVCPYSAKTKNHLASHVAAKHSSTKPYSCSLCEYKAAQKIHLDSHMASKHDGLKRFTCEKCNYSAIKKNNLEKHMLTRHSNDILSCGSCDFTCSTKKGMNKHKQSHYKPKPPAPPKEKILYCHICDFTTSDKDALIDHLAAHKKSDIHASYHPDMTLPVGNTSRLNELENAEHMYSPDDTLESDESTRSPERPIMPFSLALSSVGMMQDAVQQIQSISHSSKMPGSSEHQSIEEANCHLGNLWTEYASLLSSNELQATNREKYGTCSCYLTSKNSENQPCDSHSCIQKQIDSHIRVTQPSSKQFVCSHVQCGYQTSQKARLEAHEAIKHQGIKPFVCRICNFTTAYKVSLTLHIQGKHQDMRPFQCQLCTYSAKTKNHLLNHVAAKHSSTKPYSCSLCEYTAAQKVHLDSHVASKHDGLKRFSCEQCNYSTTKKTCLVKHLYSRHNKSRIKCGLCDFECNTEKRMSWHVKSHNQTESKDSKPPESQSETQPDVPVSS